MKRTHEFRDPIHVFIRMDSDERRIVDSPQFQRLRFIHQLAMSYLVYPGAVHSRFEHSLGVMELASRVFDVITHPDCQFPGMPDHFRELQDPLRRDYWRRTLRMAALCHDLGHLPFSHAAEKELLPVGWSHEKLTAAIIRSSSMKKLWREAAPWLDIDVLVKLAVGPRKAEDVDVSEYSNLESVLAEIIVGDAFGVDRMDYLLRDSYYAGVAYGRFDHFRLIDTLRILPPPPEPDKKEQSNEPMLGVEEGGLPSAEQMLLARYFMFVQVYYHPIRRIYDRHLQEFLSAWLPGKRFPTTPSRFLRYNDVGVTQALLDAADNSARKGHIPAMRIVKRRHFKVLYQPTPRDLNANSDAANLVYRAAKRRLGKFAAYLDVVDKPERRGRFPVWPSKSEEVVDSFAKSKTLASLPQATVSTVYIDPEQYDAGQKWFKSRRDAMFGLPSGRLR